VSGTSDEHAGLERELAEFEGQESALLFPTGFAANMATVPAMAGEGDAIYSDAANHASVIDGIRLAKATRHVYRHGDAEDLERWLAQGESFRRRLIITESLFSMDGDLAPLVAIGELAQKYDAMLLVDEAHATGVWGAQGRGVVEHFASTAPALEEQVAIRVGTLSKGIGSLGGFVVGSRNLTEWLAHMGRAHMFSTAAPAVVAAAGRAALRVVREEPERRQRVLARAAYLRSRLVERGWNVGNSASQIIPIMVGEPTATMNLSQRLHERGLWVPGIRPPTVAPGTSRLRVSLTAAHTEAHLDRLVTALDEVRD
jgi:8-amino-7-oxononanoate synthase